MNSETNSTSEFKKTFPLQRIIQYYLQNINLIWKYYNTEGHQAAVIQIIDEL